MAGLKNHDLAYILFVKRVVVVQFEPYSSTGGIETCLAESQAAAVKHKVMTLEKAIGMTKR